MGSSSKVILVGATSLIVGVYAISLKKAEVDGVQAAMKNVNRVQSERFEDAALRTALYEYAAENGARNKSGSKRGLGGKEFTYSIKNNITPATRWTPVIIKRVLTLTYENNGSPVKIIANLEKVPTGGTVKQGARKIHRGAWEVTSVYVQRDNS